MEGIINPEILKKNLLKIDKIFRKYPGINNMPIIINDKINGKRKRTYNRKEFYNALNILSKEYGW